MQAPRFQPRRKAERPYRPSSRASVSFSLRSTVPFTQDLHISFGYELRVSVADGGAFDLSEAEKEIKISVVLAK